MRTQDGEGAHKVDCILLVFSVLSITVPVSGLLVRGKDENKCRALSTNHIVLLQSDVILGASGRS